MTRSVVFQHRSLPREIRDEKQRMPVAYLGIGILEWHGEHNAAGLDGVKADGMAARFAARFGGVVLPPLFWGDHRRDICELVFRPDVFPPAGEDHTGAIAAAMGYDLEALEANARRSDRNGGWHLWIQLLVHIFFEIESFGYRCIVPIPGHYPLFGPLDLAIAEYRARGGTCDVFPVTDGMFDPVNGSGDHAAAFETSAMLALAPDLVDLSRLDPDRSRPNVGVLGKDPRDHASVEYGEEILARLGDVLGRHLEAIGLWAEEGSAP